jgi:hypothetical protein
MKRIGMALRHPLTTVRYWHFASKEMKRQAQLRDEENYLIDAISADEIAELRRVTTLDDILNGSVEGAPKGHHKPFHYPGALEEQARIEQRRAERVRAREAHQAELASMPPVEEREPDTLTEAAEQALKRGRSS